MKIWFVVSCIALNDNVQKCKMNDGQQTAGIWHRFLPIE